MVTSLDAFTDLDTRPATAPADEHPGRPSQAWIAAGVAGLVAAVLGGMLLARPATAVADAPRPTFHLSAESNLGEIGVDPAAFIPTVTAWYADGTRADASEALYGPWRPDRPIRMLTIAAARSCAIDVDGHLAAIEQASTNRVAVCVWTAP